MIIHLERPKKYAAESAPSINPKPNTAAASKPSPIVLAIHGGAGGTIPPNMPPAMEAAYRERLRAALSRGYELLQAGHSALDAVCRAVVELENDPLFNAARGAVFDRAGQNQCEASVMIAGPALTTVTGVNLPIADPEADATTEKNQARPPSIASNRRTAAVTLVRQTKNPILLARALYLHPSCAENVLFSGEDAEMLGWQLGCEKVERNYYWTRRRWLEHRRDLGLPDGDDAAHKAGDAEGETIPPPYASHDGAAPTFEADVAEQSPEDEHGGASSHPSQSGKSSGYDADADSKSDFLSDLPKGTVGAVALDSSGRLACATSTGGKTNKYPGRIGDTPSVGAGYWAEIWQVEADKPAAPTKAPTPSRKWTFFSCLSGSAAMDEEQEDDAEKAVAASESTTSAGVAISGTGDGDYFQRTSFASLVAHRMRLLGESADVASERALEELTTVAGVGTGGAIVLDAQGKVSFPLNSATMNRGVISSETGAVPRVAIFSAEQCE